MSDDNKQDAGEPTPGSDGSVANPPVAWGLARGEQMVATSTSWHDALELQCELEFATKIVPLYRIPVVVWPATTGLTDAERIAIEHGIASIESDDEVFQWGPTPYAATLRALLKRTK